MDDLRKKHYNLDSFGLLSIGIISIGYVMFVRSFAELHIQLSFLDFPIFIGEILLFLCLCIFLLKRDLRLEKKHCWIIGYFVFVVAKALYGYSRFGPLAFRNAALFYYPVFIILANSFYRRDFFDNKKNILCSAIMIFLFTGRGFNEYWLLTFFTFVFIFGYTYPNKIFKYLLLGVLFLGTPYKYFFATSRMMMVANFAVGIYLIIGFYLFLEIRKAIKVAIVILGASLILWMSFQFSDRNALVSIIRGDKIIEAFKVCDMEFRERHEEIIRAEQEGQLREKTKSNEVVRARIYNPELLLIPSDLDEEKSVDVKERGGVSDDLAKNTLTSFQLSKTQINDPKSEVSENLAKNIVTSRSNKVQTYNPSPPLSFKPFWTKEKPEVVREISDDKIGAEKVIEASQRRHIGAAYGNAVFRLIIWRDMLVELIREKPILGFNFGKPLRSITLETLRWGEGDWKRDGWIGAHNSFLHVIYRAGIIGVLAIGAVFVILFRMIRKSIQCKSVVGILLCGIIINWFVAANFLLILELPYTAIPIWSIFGITYAYVGQLKLSTSAGNDYNHQSG